MTIIALFIAGLATWEIIELWRHGSVFAAVRAWVEIQENPGCALLRCGFCLAPWVSWLLVLPPLLISTSEMAAVPAAWLTVWCFGVYGLAVARLANLGNDLTHQWCRTPKATVRDMSNTHEDTNAD